MIYADHPDAFDEVELPVLEQMAEDLAFGISAIRTRLAREHVEQKLERSYSLLQAAMDSAADGILVTSLMGRLESHNNKVRDIWDMPDGLLESRSAAKAAQFMADCVVDPEGCWRLQREIELNPHQTYTDVLELKNGRVLQRSSAPHRFEGSIFWRVSSYRDNTDHRERERELVYMANHDVLTGLHNRNLVLGRLQMGATQAERTGQLLAILLFNLDRFNLVNDSLGHEAADELLKTVAQRLQTRARAGDTVARVGGDEFVVMLSSVKHDEDAAGVGHQLLAAISEPVLLGRQDFHISASLGIALCPRDGYDAATLLMRAIAAMHNAKARGGNCFQFVTTDISEQIARRVRLAERLRHAIKRQELSLHFQPQFSANSDQLVGAEALLRWRNSELGDIAPAEFIPIAEETGLIIEVGQWVAETVCRTQRQWREAGLVPVKIAINLSACQLDHDDLLRALPACVELYGVATQWLEVEITEGALMKHPEKSASMLRAFKDLGFGIAIDDFGTGYSSMGYLKRFPVDKLKIDKSFIDEVPANMTDVAITRAIIAMAHELNVEVVAEGVETREQHEYLRMHGCDAIQGYLRGKPIPAFEFEGLLRSVTMRSLNSAEL